jgi:hypothetical protein
MVLLAVDRRNGTGRCGRPDHWSSRRRTWFAPEFCAAADEPGLRNLIRIKAGLVPIVHQGHVWKPVSTAPFDRDLELAVIDQDGPHTLVFPCRRVLNGWIKAESKEGLTVHPTHWRPWGDTA